MESEAPSFPMANELLSTSGISPPGFWTGFGIPYKDHARAQRVLLGCTGRRCHPKTAETPMRGAGSTTLEKVEGRKRNRLDQSLSREAQRGGTT